MKTKFLGIIAGAMLSSLLFLCLPANATTTTAEFNTDNWTFFNAPGSDTTLPMAIDTDVSGSKVVGCYVRPDYYCQGFFYDGTNWTTLNKPGASYTIPRGISGNKIIGFYSDPVSGVNSFVYDGANWSGLNYPGALRTLPYGISGNVIVGSYIIGDYEIHGFSYDGSNWTTIDVPGAYSTSVTGFSNGKYAGSYYGPAGQYGFTYDGSIWNTIQVPPGYFSVYGISGNNVVGYYQPDPFSNFGFLFDGTDWINIAVPDALLTTASGISGDKVVGYFSTSAGSTGFIFSIAPSTTALGQFKLDGTTPIANGAVADNGVVLKGTPTSPIGKQVKLQVEVQPYGTAFTGVATAESTYVSSSTSAAISISNLTEGSYHWQARAVDSQGNVSQWTAHSAGADFVVSHSVVPTLSNLGQFKLDGTTQILSGASTTESAIVLQGTPTSPNGDPVQLQVELRLNDVPFTGIPTAASSFVASGAPASVKLTGLLNGHYHWQARAVDTMGNMSSWLEFDPSWTTNFFVIAFNPIPNGYNFENKKSPDLSYDEKMAILNAVYWNVESTPTGVIDALLNDDYLFGKKGNCLGMALAAIKEFNGTTNYVPNWQTIYYDVPAPDVTMFSNEWIVNNFSLFSTLGYIFENQAASLGTGYRGSMNTGDQLVQGLLNNNPSDFILTLHQDVNSVRKGHSVLPYRIETVVPSQEYNVYIYDPNYSGDEGRFLTLKKQGDGWNRVADMGPHGIWESAKENDTALIRVSGYIFENGTKLKLSTTTIAKNTAEAIVQNENGQMAGYSSNQVVQDIPDVVFDVPVGVTSDSTFTPEYWFRGNLDQNLTFHLKPNQVGNADEKMSLLKWAPTGYVQASFSSTVDQPQIFINADNSQVTIASTTGSFTLSIDNASNGQDNVINISATSTSVSSSNTYLIDWGAIAAGQDGVTLQINPGDGTATHSVQIGSDFSDNATPTTTPIISGTLGQNSWYSSDISVLLNAADNESGVGVKQIKYSLDNNGVWLDYVSTSPISVNTEGIHTLQFDAEDYFGNQEATNTIILAVDKTPPLIMISEIPSSTILGAPLTFIFTSNDSLSGIVATTATIDGQSIDHGTTLSNLNPGNHIFQVTATDNAGNVAVAQTPFSVIYNFTGFLPPIKSDGSGLYNLGRTLPIKFNLTDSSNNPTTSAIAQLVITNVQNGIIGTDPINLDTAINDSGSLFRISDNQYIYNLDTTQLAAGTWQVKAMLDDGQNYTVLVSLR